MKTLHVWWPLTPLPGNFGDVLTPSLLSLLGIPHQFSEIQSADAICIGSVIRFARPGMLVLGSGAISETDAPSSTAQYLAVRGPLTRAVVLRNGGQCPKVYGDPALLLPGLYQPIVRKHRSWAVIPHYVDHALVSRLYPRERVINVLRSNPLEVVQEILECDRIYSSSLHGIIVAHSYNIPAAWVQWSDKLTGNPENLKFHDYAESVGITLKPYKCLNDAVPITPSQTFDTGPLSAAFRSIGS